MFDIAVFETGGTLQFFIFSISSSVLGMLCPTTRPAVSHRYFSTATANCVHADAFFDVTRGVLLLSRCAISFVMYVFIVCTTILKLPGPNAISCFGFLTDAGGTV